MPISDIKMQLHPKNKHRERYDFKALCSALPALRNFVFVNNYNIESIDFANSEAVLALNKALLKHHYSINFWEIPEGFLCPPIPGRADYIHYLADLLAESNFDNSNIKCLDIGVGANCIYPIIGHQEYGWQFVGSDINKQAVEAAKIIITNNVSLKNTVEIRLQSDINSYFKNIIKPDEYFNITLCNPPFYKSAENAKETNLKKLNNLNHKKTKVTKLNFGGQENELWCDGGELRFIKNMIKESVAFSKNCHWFTTLVSQKDHLKAIYKELEFYKVSNYKTIEMAQGQKISRLVAWTYMN